MTIPDTAQEIFAQMPAYFQPAAAGNDRAKLQFNLSGEGGGTWSLEVADGQCRTHEGPAANPDLTLSLAASDFLALITGELDATKAVMTGRIRFKGNIGLGTKLLKWFKY